MKFLSRLFRTSPPPASAPVVAEPPAAPREPAPPPVDPAEQQRLLSAIESGTVDAGELMRLAVEGQTTRVRQAAAAAINDPAAWQALLPRLRGRDKAAYKLIRQRVDALLAEQREKAQATAEAETLCAAFERLANRPVDSLSAGLLAGNVARWQVLPDFIDPALRERGQAALARCQQAIDAHERELARLAAERAAEEARVRAEEQERLARQREAEEQAALEAQERALAAQALHAEAQAAAEAAAAETAATADAAGTADAADETLTETPAEVEPAPEDTQAHKEILSLIRLSGAAIGRGDTRKAARFRTSIDELLPTAPALPAHIARNLEQLDERLNQLRQWKDFAAAPKRLELIEEVEALIGVDEPPESLLEHLQALRQEWRTINKGLAVDATAEAERFEQAYKAAFQPCQVYLAGQAAIRRANLEARKQVLERVRAFETGLDAEHPDHPLIMRVLREAPQEWRNHAPVDRDAARGLDGEFFGTLDRLRAKVNAWHAANTSEKQALIAKATQLATATDLPRAIEEAKRLQVEWKSTGPIPHAQSQKLWEEFRAACNVVFARRQEEFAQQSATLEHARLAAEALCEQIEQAGQQGPSDRPGGEAKLREWQQAFEALGELPRSHARNLRDRYQRAMNSYDAQIAGLAKRDAQAVEANALAAAAKVRAYQRAVIQGAGDEELKSEAEAFIAGVTRWPNKAIPQALRQAVARADAGQFSAADDAAREQALRGLCIRAEILSGSPTPPEDAALRRQQEMQLLSQGLGQARQADERAWEAMRIEWLGLDPVEPALRAELEQRFTRCLERARFQR